MKITEIMYPTALSKIKDISDDNIDVLVTLEDGNTYVVVVTTPKNFYDYMERNEIDYFCGVPEIVVKTLTADNIERAITAYAENDAYWLKTYYLAGVIGIETLDREMELSKTNYDDDVE